MDALRALYRSLNLRDPQTCLQSGNVVFRTEERNLIQLATGLETAIERTFSFRPAVIFRTASELADVVAANPFAKQEIEPSKLLVIFLASDPGHEAREKVRAIKADPEEVRIQGRELYIYFPDGMGRSKLPLPLFEKAVKMPSTGRNWNTVLKLLVMAQTMEASG